LDPKIIITYSSKDKQVAETVCDALERRGLVCWISCRDVRPGQNYQEQIVRTIRAVRVMVLVFTANANNSNEIKKELALASQSNLVVIPVRIEDVAPNEAFAYEFATRQWIDLFDDWESSITRLIEQIVSIIEDDPPVHPANAAPGATGGAAGLPGSASAKPRAGPRRAASTSWPASRWVMIAGVVVIIAASAVAYEFVLAPKPVVVSATAGGSEPTAVPAPTQAPIQKPQPAIQATPAPKPQPQAQTAPAPRPSAQPAPPTATSTIPDQNYADEYTNFGVPPQNFLQANVATPTPTMINGGRVVSTAVLYTELRSNGNAILIDAWNESGHATLPGARRLPVAGAAGNFNDAEEQRLVGQLRELTANNPNRALVFFCQGARCWESYNAALRAIHAGFTAVYWYRGGVLAWEAAGLPTHF
jgi:PQQ-dependent catabolism-associated CXXCW motif protein